MTDDFDPTESTEETFETSEEISAREGIYGEIKRALISRGIPAEEIAFIHDYPTPAKKSKVFDQVNAGKIRVLIGSTDKMGLGANFQQRLAGLHHLSAAFRASDISQREGRILRQGNIFPEIHICAYVTESSFDAFMWGLVETKARFISQIMAGEVTARTAEDIDDMVMTAAQIKAIASGNPQILEKVALEVELTRLERLYSVWSAGRRRLRCQLETLPSQLDSISREIAGHQRAIATRDQNDCDDFTIEFKKNISSEELVAFTDRQRAGAHLRQLCFGVIREAQSAGRINQVIGGYRGFEILARASGRQIDSLSPLFSYIDLFLRAGEGEQAYGFKLGESDAGVIQSMDAQLRGLDVKLEKSLASQRELEHRRLKINAELSNGWEHAEKYRELKLRLDALNQSLTNSGAETEPSLDLSKLDEDAFQPVESRVSVHQVHPIAEQSTGTIVTDIRPAQIDDGNVPVGAESEAESEPNIGFSVAIDENQTRTTNATKRKAISKAAKVTEQSRQMRFDWS